MAGEAVIGHPTYWFTRNDITEMMPNSAILAHRYVLKSVALCAIPRRQGLTRAYLQEMRGAGRSPPRIARPEIWAERGSASRVGPALPGA